MQIYREGEGKKSRGATQRRVGSAIAFVPADKERPRISRNKFTESRRTYSERETKNGENSGGKGNRGRNSDRQGKQKEKRKQKTQRPTSTSLSSSSPPADQVSNLSPPALLYFSK